MKKPKGVYFCAQSSMDRVYGPEQQVEIAKRLDMYECLVTRDNWREHREALSTVEVIVSSWVGAILDDELLSAMPLLSVYFYGAGSIRELMTDAAWERGVRITSAADANAVPVAEFVLAQTLFSLKRGWEYMQLAKADSPEVWHSEKAVAGAYRSTVGVVSLGKIGKKLCNLLRPFDVHVLAYSIDTSAKLSEELGNITFCSLETVFKSCDVVSIHLPLNTDTEGMIGKELLSLMKPNATLINTARGSVINQSELISFLHERTDVYACLDVTTPEPPESGSPLFDLPNVVITPHLAGSVGKETRRLGTFVIEEIDRYLGSGYLKWEVTREIHHTLA